MAPVLDAAPFVVVVEGRERLPNLPIRQQDEVGVLPSVLEGEDHRIDLVGDEVLLERVLVARAPLLGRWRERREGATLDPDDLRRLAHGS